MKKRRSAAAEHCVEHDEDSAPGGGTASAGWSRGIGTFNDLFRRVCNDTAPVEWGSSGRQLIVDGLGFCFRRGGTEGCSRGCVVGRCDWEGGRVRIRKTVECVLSSLVI